MFFRDILKSRPDNVREYAASKFRLDIIFCVRVGLVCACVLYDIRPLKAKSRNTLYVRAIM